MRCAQCAEPLLTGLEEFSTVFCNEECRDHYKASHTRDLEGMAEE